MIWRPDSPILESSRISQTTVYMSSVNYSFPGRIRQSSVAICQSFFSLFSKLLPLSQLLLQLPLLLPFRLTTHMCNYRIRQKIEILHQQSQSQQLLQLKYLHTISEAIGLPIVINNKRQKVSLCTSVVLLTIAFVIYVLQ